MLRHPTTDARAQSFVTARQAASPLARYPGDAPASLAEAYAIQDSAIDAWADEIVGWKVGRIPEPHANQLGQDRLAGPVFKDWVRQGGAMIVSMPAFSGGFSAIEGEFLVLVGQDPPSDKRDWSIAQARDYVGAIYAGLEIASSPFSGINSNGPLVTISDFGNNYGLVVGEEVEGWRDYAIEAWTVETAIDGQIVGRGRASDIPGGPIESFRFLLENAAARGRPLRKGMLVSTGAVSGVHEAAIGAEATVSFFGAPALTCRLAAAVPSKSFAT